MAKAIAVADNNGDKNETLERLKSGPQRLMDFLRDVRSEMRKVVTPSRAEVQSMTIVVLVTVVVFAVYFAVVDYVISHGIEWMLHKTTGQ
jgi:preprotein translocase subunit SecE